MRPYLFPSHDSLLLRPPTASSAKWTRFFAAFKEARREGIHVSWDLLVLQSESVAPHWSSGATAALASTSLSLRLTLPPSCCATDSELDALREGRLDSFDLKVPLGPDPSDFTLFVRTRLDKAQQHLERCLKGEWGT